MTKEEKIKGAWGILIPEFGVKANGWSCEQILNKDLEKYRNGNFDIIYSAIGAFVRPKSLEGIEYNNGWIKIESEADLPTEIGIYWVKDRFRENVYKQSFSEELKKAWMKVFTHYQPIEKPQPPIY